MTLRSLACALIVGTLIAGCAGSTGQGQESADSRSGRAPRNRAELEQMFKAVSNWGRWGKDDQLGTVNLITNDKRRQAAALVKTGISVSLTPNLMTEQAADNPGSFEHTMGKSLTVDTLTIQPHSTAVGHIDALCHYPYDGRTFYNGYTQADVANEKGCFKFGIQNLKDKILTRAVLIDIPRLKGIPFLEPGTPVYAEDIEAWEKKAGVKVGAGDAIILRTGRWLRRERVGPWELIGSPAARSAGFHASVAPWFKARDVAFVGSDSHNEVVPTLVEGIVAPLAELLLAGVGVHILESMDLEAVAETAAKLNRWEFMLTGAPLAVNGGTGSPITLTATF